MNNKEAMFYTQLNEGNVQCNLCPHNCKIPEGSAGFCTVRKNMGGRLYATSYAKASALALDPIEKKPLYMFRQGSQILSVGGFGCNFRCPFCQNSGISLDYDHSRAELVPPEHLTALALQAVSRGNIGIAYTYNEPLIGYEYLLDSAKLVHKAGLANIIVTNGSINQRPLEALLPYIDAMNIDLKSFSPAFYENIKGSLETTKQTITLASKHCHIEVTSLIIPNENDSESEMTQLASWLSSINPNIPLHLSRFFPRHNYAHKAPTPKETIYKLKEIAQKHLVNVFVGNMNC
ncbi:MAG: AmmeMemoRadiSam system radical SAM enzyme [Defluviitaleaceae bacterium]|nr:AmmeMemoRadiSam system radical SAM enzyme [Defluviitaleaceae bacterium]